MSRRTLFVVCLSLAFGIPTANAQRVRPAKAGGTKVKAAQQKQTTPRRKAKTTATLKNAMPKRIGEGFFSRVYRSRDGNWVMKKMRPAIAGVEPVTKSQRATMAKTTVKVGEALRKAGFPVPQSYIPKGKEGVIVQKFSSGLTFEQLQGKSKFEASKNQMVFFGKAIRSAKKLKGYDSAWYIDKNRDNLLFDKSGKITSWIDPVVPTTGAKIHRVLDKLQAASVAQ